MAGKQTTRQRMEQRVKTCLETCACPCPDCAPKEIVKLMEAEHRRLRAKVRRLREESYELVANSPSYRNGYQRACDDILKALK